MAERPFIFRGGSTELVLPVTPAGYRVETGVNVEVVNIHQLGDVVLAGYGTLATIKINCMLPARPYPFARDSDAQYYIEQLRRWTEQRKQLRFIVGNTGVNIPVIIENINWGEQDGTNDVYADIILREYRKLRAGRVASAGDSQPREEVVKPPQKTDTGYTIQYGDTLSALCRQYYGDGSASTYTRLAEYNDIPNPHMIVEGKTIRLPQPLP